MEHQESSLLFEIENTSIFVLKKIPFVMMERDLVSRLSCPLDLTYSDRMDPSYSTSLQGHPDHSSLLLIDEANLAIEGHETGEQKKRKIEDFVQRYSKCPSLAYRCPFLSGWKSTLLFFALTLAIKALFAFNSNSHLYNAPKLAQGDGEFHRHWIEITTHLPVGQWYSPGPLNPKSHCFLDYPILAAFFHAFLGQWIISPLHPQAAALSSLSREVTPALPDKSNPLLLDSSLFNRSHKYFFLQRLTFLISDTLLLGSASLSVAHSLWPRVNRRLRFSAALMIALTPMAILIDHGNPQVNFLSLGFFLFAFRFALSSHFALSAAFAVCAVSSKVTAVSVMLPFLVLVLSRLFHSPHSLFSKFCDLLRICLSAVSAFSLLHLPLVLSGSFSDMLLAVFPFGRGIVEMKNPTFWQAFVGVGQALGHDFYKSTLPIFKHSALVLTFLFQAPSLLTLFRSPSTHSFILSLQHCALSFFLFGFCTHEKVLLWFAFTSSLSLFR